MRLVSRPWLPRERCLARSRDGSESARRSESRRRRESAEDRPRMRRRESASLAERRESRRRCRSERDRFRPLRSASEYPPARREARRSSRSSESRWRSESARAAESASKPLVDPPRPPFPNQSSLQERRSRSRRRTSSRAVPMVFQGKQEDLRCSGAAGEGLMAIPVEDFGRAPGPPEWRPRHARGGCRCRGSRRPARPPRSPPDGRFLRGHPVCVR